MANTFKEVQGSDVILMFDFGDGFLPFVCAKDFSIETTASRVNITTKGDGPWDKSDYQSLSYTLNASGVIAFDASAITSFDLALQQQNFLTPAWKAVFMTKDHLNAITYKGVCLIERTAISANAGQLSLSDFSLPGTGAYVMIDCDITIGEVSVSATLGERFVFLTGITGGPAAAFIWALDHGFENTETADTFSIGTLTNGEHTIEVTPVCGNGKRGEPNIFVFLVFGEPVAGVVTCHVVENMNISDITETSFYVNFDTVVEATNYRAFVKNTVTGATVVYGDFFSPTGVYTESPIPITGLLEDTEYQVWVVTNCGPVSHPNIDHSDFSTVFTVRTNARVCPVVASVTATNITSSGFHLEFPGAGGPYVLEYWGRIKKVSTGVTRFPVETSGSSPMVVTGLEANTQYECSVTTLCNNSDGGIMQSDPRIILVTTNP